jgi:hypothetical protein
LKKVVLSCSAALVGWKEVRALAPKVAKERQEKEVRLIFRINNPMGMLSFRNFTGTLGEERNSAPFLLLNGNKKMWRQRMIVGEGQGAEV